MAHRRLYDDRERLPLRRHGPWANRWDASTATRSRASSSRRPRPTRRSTTASRTATAVRTASRRIPIRNTRGARTSATTSGATARVRRAWPTGASRSASEEMSPLRARRSRIRWAVSTIPSNTRTSRCRSISTTRWETLIYNYFKSRVFQNGMGSNNANLDKMVYDCWRYPGRYGGQVRALLRQRSRLRQPQLLAHLGLQRREGRLPVHPRRDARIRPARALD